MLKYKLGPVVAGERKSYSDRNDRTKPMLRKDGSPVEYLEYRVEGEDWPRQITLDRTVNGSCPSQGELVAIVVEETVRQEARLSRAGNPYLHRKEARRAIAFEPARAAA